MADCLFCSIVAGSVRSFEVASTDGCVEKLSAAVETGLGAKGSFVAMNSKVSQSVAHLHVHAVPRTTGDGLRVLLAPHKVRIGRGDHLLRRACGGGPGRACLRGPRR